MARFRIRRIFGTLSKRKQEALEKVRRQIKQELPELIKKGELLRKAQQEPTFSGELRRAIHSSRFLLPIIGQKAKVSLVVLDKFLIGEKPLPSDVIDRLVEVLGYRLRPLRGKAS